MDSNTENEAAIKGLADVASLMMAYKWQEKVYLHDDAASKDFKELVRPLYANILEFEAKLLVHKAKSTTTRWASNVFYHTSWTKYVASIEVLDSRCRIVTSAIEGVRAKEWQEEERRWWDKLFQQPRRDKETENIKKLYSNYESHKNINPTRIIGTCEWFLNHTNFLVWRESQASSLLWLSADPGCGKSVLSKHLVDGRGEALTVNAERPTICYFFFKETDHDRIDASKAICAFLHQLIMQQPQLYRHVEEDFENKGDAFLKDVDAMWTLFLKAIADSATREVICVLDALDECEKESRRSMTANIVRIFSSRHFKDSEKSILKLL